MKNEFQGERKRKVRFAERQLMALVLVFALMLTIPFLSNAAEKFEAGKTCSMTVGTDAENLPEDLAKAGVVIDLYKVADAVPFENSDGYSFALCAPFAALSIKSDADTQQWRDLSQQAAKIILDSNITEGKNQVKSGAAINTPISNLETGLYLLIARGKDFENYMDKNANGEIVTKAYSNGYTYTFLPELVALPGKEPVGDNAQEAGVWKYDIEVILKMEWEGNKQYGAIRIIKTLEGFDEDNGPATFVFDVEAELDGKNVYSDVVTLVFDKAGEEKLLVEGIPVGAKVTVTEVYSGASYSLVTDKTKKVIINTAKDIPEVRFKNKHNDYPNGGHSITNHFRREKNGWKLDQLYDKTQG